MLRLVRFIKVLWSFFIYGDVKLTVYEARLEICEGCPQIRKTKRGIFCDQCGCPESALSDLRTKARIRLSACPVDKW